MALAVCATWLSHPRVPTILYNSALALVVIVTADLVRFRSDRFEKFYESVLGLFMREEEKVSSSRHFSGVTTEIDISWIARKRSTESSTTS